MKLYLHPHSPNSRKPLAVARHLRLCVDEVAVDMAACANREPEFLAINPNGKVPALVDGTTSIWESSAICVYLAHAGGGSLLPDGFNGQVELTRWIAWSHAHLSPPLGTLTYQNLFAGEARDDGAVRGATAESERYLAVLDKHLVGKRWLAGDDLSILDFILGAELTYAKPGRFPLSAFERVGAWMARLDELDAWRTTAPPMRGKL